VKTTGAVTDYISMEAMAKCPNCRRGINEKTLVELAASGGAMPIPLVIKNGFDLALCLFAAVITLWLFLDTERFLKTLFRPKVPLTKGQLSFFKVTSGTIAAFCAIEIAWFVILS